MVDKMPKRIKKELKKIILWKLDVEVPSNFKLSIGKEGTFTKEELKERIIRDDKIGRLYVEMQLNFMRSLAKGEFSSMLVK